MLKNKQLQDIADAILKELPFMTIQFSKNNTIGDAIYDQQKKIVDILDGMLKLHKEHHQHVYK